MPGLGTLFRFVLAAAIGGGGALGVAAVTSSNVQSLARPGAVDSLQLTSDTDNLPIGFGLVAVADAQPVALLALPDDQTLQLVAYAEPGTTPYTGTGAAPWWNSAGHPRVTPISQFDGSPLANKNCTLASGAMLARLAFGIVTTGGQLRTLSGVASGGTTLGNLQHAISTGWGVGFSSGALTPLQLRSLMYAGAGAVVQGWYGEIPANLSLQPSFKEGHSIYLDGFRPAGPDGPAAYWVMDPLGHTWSGYRGAWWPADIIERFGTHLGGGRILTSWAFAGGGTPSHYPPLPPSAWPSEDLPSPEPGSSLVPVPTPAPLPVGDPVPPTLVTGDIAVAIPPDWVSVIQKPVVSGKWQIDPDLLLCIGPGAPASCPAGLVAIFPQTAIAPPTLSPVVLAGIKLLYADSVQPGLMRVIFEAPDGTVPALQYWPSDGSGGKALSAPTIEAMLLDGKIVQVATFPVDPSLDYTFIASALGDGVRAISPVGTLGGP